MTEFLPISSSAHLVLVPYLFNWHYAGTVFDISLHLGTLVAVVGYFGADFWRLIRAGLTTGWRTKDGQLFWMIMVASIPAAVVGYFFEDAIDTVLRHSVIIIAGVLASMGVVLWYVDRFALKQYDEQSLSLRQSLLIGFAQALALLPGVSRSGATMTAGLAFGLTREAAARFSFWLSGPILVAAVLFKLRDLGLADVTGPFVTAVAVAAIVGYASIGWLLRYVQRGSFAVFAWYRLAVAAAILVVAFIRG